MEQSLPPTTATTNTTYWIVTAKVSCDYCCGCLDSKAKASIAISESEEDVEDCIKGESAVNVHTMVDGEREQEAYGDEY